MERKSYLVWLAALVLAASVFETACSSSKADPAAPPDNSGNNGVHVKFIATGSMLNGLAANAVFPFIDTTPNNISQAHIAITDATTSCAAGAAAPSNVKVLVGQAGVSLVSVMTAATNTGIGSASQCVFHVTIAPGESGVPNPVTDIVVANGNASTALTGENTATASATVLVTKQEQENESD